MRSPGAPANPLWTHKLRVPRTWAKAVDRPPISPSSSTSCWGHQLGRDWARKLAGFTRRPATGHNHEFCLLFLAFLDGLATPQWRSRERRSAVSLGDTTLSTGGQVTWTKPDGGPLFRRMLFLAAARCDRQARQGQADEDEERKKILTCFRYGRQTLTRGGVRRAGSPTLPTLARQAAASGMSLAHASSLSMIPQLLATRSWLQLSLSWVFV